MKALPISVYTNPRYKGCSNNGISEKYDELLLICEEGYIDIDENDPPENLVKLVKRKLFGGIYMHIEPYKKAQGVGYMSGGSLGYSSDSRFRRMSQYPLSIHDRQESQDEYDRYGR